MPGVIFWVWFLASIAVAGRYPWIDTVWVAVGWSLLVVASVFSVWHIFRQSETSEYVGYRMIPPWLLRVLGADEDH
jgi:hypothetical protein